MTAKRLLLLVPPVSSSYFTQLSVPLLTGHLRAQGCRVEQRDLNIEFYDHLRALFEIEPAGHGPPRPQDTFMIKEAVADHFMRQYLERARGHSDDLARLIYSRRTDAVPDSLDDIDPEEISYSAGTGMGLGFKKLILCAPQRIPGFVEDRASNPYHRFYDQIDLADQARGCDVVGFSILSPNQLIASLTLAHRLKQDLPQVQIALGGIWVTMFIDELTAAADLARYFDLAVCGDGEPALTALLRGAPAAEVPNLYVKQDQGFAPPARLESADVHALVPPDYDGIDFSRYVLPKTVLYQTSRGCYWGNCAFCVHKYSSPRYRPRRLDAVKQDLRTLVDLHDPEFVVFCDLAHPVKRLVELSSWMVEQGFTFRWHGYCRFEPELTREALATYQRAGMFRISLGVETGSDKILQLINKGQRWQDMRRILGHCRELGLHTTVTAMLGLPRETAEDAQKTVDLVGELRALVSEAYVILFRLERGCDIHAHPDRYGITPRQRPERVFDNQILFDNPGGLSSLEAYRVILAETARGTFNKNLRSDLLISSGDVPLSRLDADREYTVCGTLDLFEGVAMDCSARVRHTADGSLVLG